MKEYQDLLQHLSRILQGRVKYLITKRADEEELAGDMNEKLIPLQVLYVKSWFFVAFLHENGYEYNSVNYHRTAIFAHNIHVSNEVSVL